MDWIRELAWNSLNSFDVGPEIQEQLDHIDLTVGNARVQHRRTARLRVTRWLVDEVCIGSRLKQLPSEREVILAYGFAQIGFGRQLLENGLLNPTYVKAPTDARRQEAQQHADERAEQQDLS